MSVASRPHLSVIIPFYRELELISRSVESVVSNVMANFGAEILICNDGDISEQEIRSMLSEEGNRLVRVLYNKGAKGPGAARNIGLEAACGDIIAFLDADDYWLDGKVQAQVAEMQKGATFVVTAYQFDIGRSVITPPSYVGASIDVFIKRGIGTSTVMVARDLLSSFRFREIRFAQDIDFWYALAGSPLFRYAALDTCYVTYSTGGSTKNKWIQLQYLCLVLSINRVGWLNRLRVLVSYIAIGIYNHYIGRYRSG